MFYAVKNGKEGNKVYSSWHYAKENSQNIKGSSCKKFKDFKEATDFLEKKDEKSVEESISNDNICNIYGYT